MLLKTPNSGDILIDFAPIATFFVREVIKMQGVSLKNLNIVMNRRNLIRIATTAWGFNPRRSWLCQIRYFYNDFKNRGIISALLY